MNKGTHMKLATCLGLSSLLLVGCQSEETSEGCLTYASVYTIERLDSDGEIFDTKTHRVTYDSKKHTLITTICSKDCGEDSDWQRTELVYANDQDFIADQLLPGKLLAKKFEQNGYLEEYQHDEQGRAIAIQSYQEDTETKLEVKAYDQQGRVTQLFNPVDNWQMLIRFEGNKEFREFTLPNMPASKWLTVKNELNLVSEFYDLNANRLTERLKPGSVQTQIFCMK
ncbi:hypothetical protein VST7929_02582 [Vibrio stylophorae]|uniref:Lipoprotein n=1 Tax=Vibrio stylophorae TaxID=659351 RepID=A0ABM8ZWB6_9VIBR|nr:hypothetical protein [Vibrio stylophorae]CAH0534632.1 hypothetical protein VST7929_02582 [Vibrio stylophorae]